MSNGKTKKLTVFIDAVDNFTVEVKQKKVGSEYIVLDSNEWMELQTKKPNTYTSFSYSERIAGKTDELEMPKHSIFI